MGNKVFIQREKCDHVRIKNDTGGKLEQYDFAIVGPFAAIADEIVLDGVVGAFHVEEGIQVQIGADNFAGAEKDFAIVGAPVYWNNDDKSFRDTIQPGYYLVGHIVEAKDGGGVVVFEKTRYAKVVPADLTDIQNEILGLGEDIDAITDLAGIPFMAKATLTSAAGATPVDLLEDADIPDGMKAYVHTVFATVDGAIAWGTVTKVTIKDTEDEVGAEFAAGALLANAVLTLADADVKGPISKGAGFTEKKGLVVVADATGTGSDLIVTVFGYLA